MADGFVGAKLRITTSDGSYTGIVHSIDSKKRKLTLTNVVACSTGCKLHGFHHFYGHELDNLELLETQEENATNSEKGKESIQETSRGEAPKPAQQQSQPQQGHSSSPGFGRGRGLRGRAQNKPVFRDVSDGGRSLLQRSPLVADKYLSDNVSDGDELTEPMDPPELVLVAEFGEAFENAVKFIKTQRVIGVSCEGVNLGRHGRLCWLVIACRRFVYLFDVLTLGASCFEEGLQDVLESGDILKVTHDCRQMSDVLFHQYEVKLVNVFDTQVADVLIFRNEKGGELPRRVNGLVACMYEYLNLSPELLHFQKVRKKHMQKNPSVWADRPLSDALLDSIGKHAMYLRELRHAQMERLMAEFIYGVDIYLSVARDAKFPRDPGTTRSQLPPQFKELKRFRYRHRSRRYDDEFNDNFEKPIPEDVKWSQAAWLEGKQFTEELDGKGEQARARKGSPAEFLQEVVDEKEQFQFENADSTDFVGRRDVSLSGEANNVPQELDSSQFERLCIQTEPHPSGAQQRSPNASLAAPVTASSRPVQASSLPIFTSSDFPPLGSSDSESAGSPPTRSSFRTRDTRHSDSLSGSLRAPRASSPLIEAAAALPGRGRASALLRNAMTPAARLPAMDRPLEPESYEFRGDSRVM